VVRPERVEQRFARHRDEVGRARLQDRLGLRAVENQAHGLRRDTRPAPHGSGERHLESQLARHHGRGDRARDAARRTVDDVDAARLERARKLDRVLDTPDLAADVVDRRDAEEERLVRRPRGAHRLDDLEREAHARGEVAAIGVGPGVGQR